MDKVHYRGNYITDYRVFFEQAPIRQFERPDANEGEKNDGKEGRKAKRRLRSKHQKGMKVESADSTIKKRSKTKEK